jgi:hypothetical protein
VASRRQACRCRRPAIAAATIADPGRDRCGRLRPGLDLGHQRAARPRQPEHVGLLLRHRLDEHAEPRPRHLAESRTAPTTSLRAPDDNMPVQRPDEDTPDRAVLVIAVSGARKDREITIDFLAAGRMMVLARYLHADGIAN